MTARPFRFGVTMLAPAARAEWVDKCRKAEELGYDVLGVADHLGMPPPFPSLVLAAEVTERVRLCTYVLNAGFYNPALLAREVAGTDQFVGGRLELGIGAGYVRSEFESAGLPFPGGGARVGHLERTVTALRGMFAAEEHRPRPARPSGPPLMIAGQGDRVLRLAARHADVIGFSGTVAGNDVAPPVFAPAEVVAERTEFARAALGERAAEVEFNIIVFRVVPGRDRREALERLSADMPNLSMRQLEEVPTALAGTPEQMAEQLRAARERFGFSYLTVLEPSMTDFAPVIELLR
ncbi:LLM class F420-dependent oxidoreductase [Amycolatopsis cihanbeyliensis]|uniref:Putative F420-dependent oxidoreductase n=1 Tax=Amycolatopsis cihanbeyliensis TaxID=1128664 RepID=A0A542DL56_AMYCI|nr:LLM class F420-dependent oxidoreductase [Amycolatopsis cihanbeyliensis]TQJ03764.1 putative F420-dependent oxidoreductase [Amycolatopsis cihanbeyliensis]